ncbi:MAG: sn-glycerol-3-phosphate ABC transporter ATP-binding protein UgpC [Chthoniobacteraceae bacterium]|jgi:multiple sugar transport system ATP-binding protein
MAKVSVQHVSKIYTAEKGREVLAVQDFTLDVNDREFVVFAGPSGCGKSTTLRLIAGLEEISSGDIYIGDKRVNDLPPKDRDIAMVFRNYALYPHMTVYDNLAFGLKLRKFPKPEIKKRVNEAAGILGIEKHLNSKPKHLSGGDRQRVAVGRAIAQQPKVFLFDEPLSNLDAKMRLQMRTEIIKLHQRLQATMIYVTHDQVEAMTMGDRIVVMKDGLIQQIDAPLPLYRAPQNLFVAGFLGSPPMNFIHGNLRQAGDALVFKEVRGGVVEFKLTGRPEAAAYAGREVVAGIRPEHIRIVTGTERPGGPRFQCLVDIVEHMGAETNVHLQTGAHTLVSRTGAAISSDEMGHRIQFEIDPATIHLFDPETTRRIVA